MVAFSPIKPVLSASYGRSLGLLSDLFGCTSLVVSARGASESENRTMPWEEMFETNY
ncbi:MAG: hypothetical protein MUO40_14850 [Anaerolineaceae bacterium]|nr:hypothetical protein [Anaerolineaceae bacterium]